MTKGTEGTFIVHYREGTCLVLLASVISMPYQKCVKKCYSNKHFHLSSVFFFFQSLAASWFLTASSNACATRSRLDVFKPAMEILPEGNKYTWCSSII